MLIQLPNIFALPLVQRSSVPCRKIYFVQTHISTSVLLSTSFWSLGQTLSSSKFSTSGSKNCWVLCSLFVFFQKLSAFRSCRRRFGGSIQSNFDCSKMFGANYMHTKMLVLRAVLFWNIKRVFLNIPFDKKSQPLNKIFLWFQNLSLVQFMTYCSESLGNWNGRQKNFT